MRLPNTILSDCRDRSTYSPLCLVVRISLFLTWYRGIGRYQDEDRHKTAVTTPFGLYQFTRMLRNSAQAFQRMMSSFTKGLRHTMAYIDDLVVYAKSEEELRSLIKDVLAKTRQWGLSFKRCKTQIGDSITFLGHAISVKGITELERNSEAIRKSNRTIPCRRRGDN